MSDVTIVLILAREELISALLGLLVESRGHQAVFAKSDETSVDALRRSKANVVIVDCDYRDCAEPFFEVASATGARVIFFSASREPAYVEKAAAVFHAPSFTFPIEPPALDLMIRQAAR